jgi:hypothetical protein
LYFDRLAGSSVLDPNRANKFMYNEAILGAYFSGNSKLTDKLKMQFGLRLESTKTKGMNAEINEETRSEYTKLFPTIYFSYVKNDNNNFGFSYGGRISRPNFNNLNPFRFYINDNSYSVGNPFLQPSLSDNFEFLHLYKNNLKTSLSLNITNDGFGVIFNTDAQNQDQVVTRENYFTKHTYGLQESFSYNKISWWTSQNSASIFLNVTKFNEGFDSEPKNGVQLYFSTNNTFIFNENTKMQVNSWFVPQHNSGLFRVGKMIDLSLALQHKFKNNIKLSLLFSDVLNRASLNNYVSTVNGIAQNYRQNESSRSFRISLSYNFGNKKIKVKERGFGNDATRRRSN